MSFTPGAGTRFLVSTGASGTTPLSGPLSITGGTATANAPVLNATQTWNNAAVTFTGWQLNVTDTASNASSLLMDLQRGGVTQFAVQKDAGGYVFDGSYGLRRATNVTTSITGGLTGGASVDLNGAFVSLNRIVLDRSNQDVQLWRDAANTLAQRNGVNAQTLRVYNTFTDASNYERGFARWGANVFQVGAEAAGTGTARDFEIVTGGSTRLTVTASGSAFFSGGIFGGGEVRASSASPIHWNNRSKLTSPADGIIKATNAATTAGSAVELDEMTAPAAPATNSVRIYAEDNGSGKTRLMALFATGAAQQIAIEP